MCFVLQQAEDRMAERSQRPPLGPTGYGYGMAGNEVGYAYHNPLIEH